MKISTRLIVFVALNLIIVSCKDDDSESEQITIEQYFESQDISDFTESDTGLFYKIENEGSGDFAVESDVLISDVLMTNLNGMVISDGLWHTSLDETSFLTVGMKEAYALIRIGGKVTVFIPSELAFGTTESASAGIRSNEDLKMEIEHQSKKMTIEEYIEENEIEGAVKTSSGLYYVILEEGEGNTAQNGQTATVHYTGKLFDDTIFDSSVGQSPFSFQIGAGNVIPGWDEGIPLFKKGEKGILLIPHHLAYGPSGAGSDIPPYEHLRFDIELVDFR